MLNGLVLSETQRTISALHPHQVSHDIFHYPPPLLTLLQFSCAVYDCTSPFPSLFVQMRQ
jgi:hypothetical protein